MADIEWTDRTWNPVRGCSRVSEGCRNCYAEKIAARFSDPGKPFDGFASRNPSHWTGRVELLPEKLEEPLRWRKPRRVFVNSMSDLFHDSLPDYEIARVFAAMAVATRHTFQVLTKRPARMLRLMKIPSGACLPNVWLGVSCEDQKMADERIPLLLQTPSAVRFVSLEPLLGPINLALVPGLNKCGSAGQDILRNFWVIVGGESGPGARPCDVEWIRSIVRQCKTAGVPCFVKQLGARAVVQHPMDTGALVEVRCSHRKGGDPSEWPEDLRIREFPGA